MSVSVDDSRDSLLAPFLPQDFGQTQDVGTRLHTFLGDSVATAGCLSAVDRMHLLRSTAKELTRLLSVDYASFLSLVGRQDVGHFLGTFLHFKRKPYQAPHAADDTYGAEAVLEQMLRDVLLIHLRLLFDSAADGCTVTGAQLYDEWLFDVPKMFDLCAHFSLSNPHISNAIVARVFEKQPQYLTDLKLALELMRDEMQEVCGKYLRTARVSLHAIPALRRDCGWLLDCLMKWLLLHRSSPHSVAPLFVDCLILEQLAVANDCSLAIMAQSLRSRPHSEPVADALYQLSVCTRLCLALFQECVFYAFPGLFCFVKKSRHFDALPMAEGYEVPSDLKRWETRERRAREFASILNSLPTLALQSAIGKALPKELKVVVESGSFCRRLFAEWPLAAECIDELLKQHLLAKADVEYIEVYVNNVLATDSAVIGGIRTHQSELESREEMALKLVSLFPDHSATFCREALVSMKWNYDYTVNAILDGSLSDLVGSGALLQKEDDDAFRKQLSEIESMESLSTAHSTSAGSQQLAEVSQKEKEKELWRMSKKERGKFEKRKREEKRVKQTLGRGWLQVAKMGRAKSDDTAVVAEDSDEFGEETAIWELFGFGKADAKLKEYQKRILKNYDAYDDEYNDAFDRIDEPALDYDAVGDEALDSCEEKAPTEARQRRAKKSDRWLLAELSADSGEDKAEDSSKAKDVKAKGRKPKGASNAWRRSGKRKHRQKQRAAAKYRRAGPKRFD